MGHTRTTEVETTFAVFWLLFFLISMQKMIGQAASRSSAVESSVDIVDKALNVS